jgi:hypothetical protein
MNEFLMVLKYIFLNNFRLHYLLMTSLQLALVRKIARPTAILVVCFRLWQEMLPRSSLYYYSMVNSKFVWKKKEI